MKSLSSVGLGLSIVFGSLMVALVAEVYYLIWWKKRLISKRDLVYMFCLKKSSSSSSMDHSDLNPREIRTTMDEQQQQQQQEEQSYQFCHLQSKLKPFDGMGNELMRPPRFLFTIVEETMEDLDQWEEPKSKAKFGSAVLLTVETQTPPYLTPIASPPFFTPPHTPPLNPLFESASDAEFNRSIRSSSSSASASPPPKLKFLKEAEEKLHKRMLMEGRVDEEDDEDEESGDMTPPSKYLKDEEDESFITINVDRSKEIGFISLHQPQIHSSSSSSSSSQVLPLSSSPSTFRSPPI